MSETTVKRDVYSIVTDRIISQLEQGSIPWRKPWSDAGQPRNLITMRPYRGMNVWLLGSLGYELNLFLTFKQVKELGGTVRKGERSHMVVFWRRKPKEMEKNDGEKEIKVVSMLRYYLVFNVAQCDGLPKEKIPVNTREVFSLEQCERIVTEMPQCPPIRFEKHQAFYNREHDYVNMPRLETFKSSEEYYSTLFHELVHSTGHPGRLNRKELMESKGKNTEKYAMEELTAEIGACYLKSYAGLSDDYFKYNVAYIKGWLEGLRNNKRFIFYASSAAQKATDFILHEVRENESEDEQNSQIENN
ncbi:MAG TPA: zincin-like metallopeptidase domain-containing protein [Bacteroidia bacterium]|jgi:antirestriction protein ArdC|nr:zincin-like metallopeptidase domain-containing protein [Bacteroidia bacterium]